MEPVLRLDRISKSFPMGEERVRILKEVSLSISAGEFVAIIGPSGSGKSTLMNLMGLLDRPDSGTFELKGRNIEGMNEEETAKARRETLGFVFQQFHLLPRNTAVENVSMPLLYSLRSLPEGPAVALLKRVGLESRLRHLPTQLSGGQQQRIAIARALVNRPEIILADEPTGNLDSASSKSILELLRELNRDGITVILITHEPEVAKWADRVITIRDGEIESDLASRAPSAKPFSNGNRDIPRDRNRSLWKELLKQSFRTLYANKLRTVLSTLGVLIGVAAVIAMLAIGKGAQESIEAQLSSLGSNLLSVRPAPIKISGISTSDSDWLKITREDAEAIRRQIPNVRSASAAVQSGNQRVAYQGNNGTTQVYGVLPGYAKMHALIPEIGRFITDQENQERALVAVIGATVSRELFGTENPLGKIIKLNKIPVRVIGILPEKGASSFGDRDDQIELPLNTAMYRILGKTSVDFLEVEVEKGADMSAVQEGIDKLLRSRHEVPPSQTEEAFRIFNMADLQEALSETSKTLSVLLLIIAGISLVVGGIGIMNIMLVSVTERTREIGLRKAVGATASDILIQFLIEAASIGILGGLLGIALGGGAALLVSVIAGWTTSISIPAVFGAFLFSSLVGMVFGLWPARRAAILNPIEALKGE